MITDEDELYAPESITLSVYNRSGNEYGVSWQTEAAGEPILEFTRESDIDFSNAVCVQAEISQGVDSVKNSTVIKCLANGEKCRWRVGDKNGTFSEPAVFKAMSHDKHEVKILVSTDTQMNHPEKTYWEYSWRDALRRNPDIELHLHLGDIVQLGGKRQLWRDTFETNKEIIRSLPMLPSAGNHDHYYEYLLGHTAVLSKMFNIDTPPQNKQNGIYYSTDCGPVHITVLCSGDMEATENHGLLDSQLEWAKKDITASDKKWKIVMLHTPLYSPGKYGSKEFLSQNPRALRMQLNEFFAQNGVDLVLSGHDHLFSETYPISGDGMPCLNTEYIEETVDGENIRLALNPQCPIHVLPGCGGDQNRDIEVDGEKDLIYFKDIVEMKSKCTAYAVIHIKDDILAVDYRMNSIKGECVAHRRFGIKKTLK